MMIVEIVVGFWSGSMALQADGWHMGSYASALGTPFAYAFAQARRQSALHVRDVEGLDPGRVHERGGARRRRAAGRVEASTRLVTPEPSRCGEAIVVAVVGLAVNFFCALLLREKPVEANLPEGAACAVHDHNRRAAYLHVVADAFTSVLAIAALVCVQQFGWYWLDPAVGIVGALVIARWSIGLLRDTSRILVDADVHADVRERVVAALGAAGVARVVDVHVWRVGPEALAVIASVECLRPAGPASLAQVVRAAVARAT